MDIELSQIQQSIKEQYETISLKDQTPDDPITGDRELDFSWKEYGIVVLTGSADVYDLFPGITVNLGSETVHIHFKNVSGKEAPVKVTNSQNPEDPVVNKLINGGYLLLKNIDNVYFWGKAKKIRV